MMVNLPPRTICDMNCFLPPGHEGPHQSELEYHPCEACGGRGEVLGASAPLKDFGDGGVGESGRLSYGAER